MSLGGDGTNRIIARTWPDVPLLPLSTGTNNVFPVTVDATAPVAPSIVGGGGTTTDPTPTLTGTARPSWCRS